MGKTITSTDSIKQLFGLVNAALLTQLLGPIWRVVAAVHLFFQPRDHASGHREV